MSVIAKAYDGKRTTWAERNATDQEWQEYVEMNEAQIEADAEARDTTQNLDGELKQRAEAIGLDARTISGIRSGSIWELDSDEGQALIDWYGEQMSQVW